MIIFGTRGVTWTKESGDFVCPGCGGSPQRYKRKTVRRFFTLYFIPLIPLDKVGEYIQCERCGGTFNDRVLSYNPAAERAKVQSDFHDYVRRMTVLAALADGQVDSKEIDAVRHVYQNLTGTVLGDSDIQQELNQVRQSGVDQADQALAFGGDLNDHGKELVIKAVLTVVSADGQIGPEEHEFVEDLATAIKMTPAHLRGILAEHGE
jgi:uncharacterized tellurite resistance protein B-like protein